MSGELSCKMKAALQDRFALHIITNEGVNAKIFSDLFTLLSLLHIQRYAIQINL